jgi:3',5'-nucleoside bisphosphate phosphatase
MFARYYTTHRPMTLVFAKSKSVEAIKEALQARRTAVYFDNYIIARKPEAEAFFKAAVQLATEKKERNGEPILLIKLNNTSGIPFDIKVSAPYNIEGFPLGQAVLKPNETTTIILKAIWKYPAQIPVQVQVNNIVVSPDEPLKTTFNIAP